MTAKDYRQFWGLHRDLRAETQASLQKRGTLLCLFLRLSDSWIITATGQFIFSLAFNGISIKASLLCGESAAGESESKQSGRFLLYVFRVHRSAREWSSLSIHILPTLMKIFDW